MIQYRQVTKKYGALTAVEDLSLEIQGGEFFGLLGPNGAGKTTIMRMTAALTAPSGGSIEIGGERVHRDRPGIKRKFGVVPQYSNLEGELSARQNLEFHGRLYGMPPRLRQERIRSLLEFAELSGRAAEAAKNFSGGMQRRLMILKALMHSPQLLLLDEPTVGLDPAARRKIWDLLRNLNRGGLTIFLTTHYMEEARNLCGRVGLIDRGKLVRLDKPDEIVAELGRYVRETFREGRTEQRFFDQWEAAVQAGDLSPGEFRVREANLEDAFIRLTSRGLGD
jgi:ABC-2 type transport system ATP-binding protein